MNSLSIIFISKKRKKKRERKYHQYYHVATTVELTIDSVDLHAYYTTVQATALIIAK